MFIENEINLDKPLKLNLNPLVNETIFSFFQYVRLELIKIFGKIVHTVVIISGHYLKDGPKPIALLVGDANISLTNASSSIRSSLFVPILVKERSDSNLYDPINDDPRGA